MAASDLCMIVYTSGTTGKRMCGPRLPTIDVCHWNARPDLTKLVIPTDLCMLIAYLIGTSGKRKLQRKVLGLGLRC